MRKWLSTRSPSVLASPASSYLHKGDSSLTQGPSQHRFLSFQPKQVDPNRPWTRRDLDGASGAMQEENAWKGGGGNVHETRTIREASYGMEQLSGEKLTATIDKIKAEYHPGIFSLVTFPSVDIVLLMHRNDLLPATKPNDLITRMLVDPRTSIKRPEKVEEVAGPQRFQLLCNLLEAELEDIVEVSSLHRMLTKYKLPKADWVPLMRGIMCAASSGKMKGMELPSIVLALAAGHADVELGLEDAIEQIQGSDDDSKKRVKVVADLFLSAGVEYGLNLAADIALQLLKANDVEADRDSARLLTLVMAKHAARDTDWRMRDSGTLFYASPKWLTDYGKRVDKDLEARLRPSDESDEAVEDESDAFKTETTDRIILDELVVDEEEGRDFRTELTSAKSVVPKESGGATASDYFARSKKEAAFSDVIGFHVKKSLTANRDRLVSTPKSRSRGKGATDHVQEFVEDEEDEDAVQRRSRLRASLTADTNDDDGDGHRSEEEDIARTRSSTMDL